MTKQITFTPTEAEIIAHRLGQLSEEDELVELFEEEDINLAQASAFADALSKQFATKNYVVNISEPRDLLILAEALEGSTYFGDGKHAIFDGLQTQQKSTAHKRAAQTAADKISKMLGRNVIPALA
ncbi:hypothetical protein V0M98_38370 (plasmid) [Pseudomonas silesiensis]|uniref:hypothetical protein n=1 Tax=Pseudomonas silesiensis TaxID=1853130 RepID=UPI0030CA5D95